MHLRKPAGSCRKLPSAREQRELPARQWLKVTSVVWRLLCLFYAVDCAVRVAQRLQRSRSVKRFGSRCVSRQSASRMRRALATMASKWILEPALLFQKVTNASISFVKARATVIRHSIRNAGLLRVHRG